MMIRSIFHSRLIHLFLFLLVGHSLLAQQTRITGKIIDNDTQDPLVGVNVSIKKKMIGTVSLPDGSFVLETQTEPPFVLMVSMVGYATQEIPINQNEEELSVVMSVTAIFGGRSGNISLPV